ncbi:hypothetical protein O181_108409 [Austropuccinia psidii MF-1]|uniref:Reverse transcriptase domain-containing protein n=1 Tax=Austropuccinia psidii MF-1 TaxID=1389203 RepID=A0A9Q3JUR0_9BASI|nr:hypothetical protein [Austropuccinia psidii MF-1]
MSEFMIQIRFLRQCGGDLEHSVKSRNTEQSSAEDMINILQEVTTRSKIVSSRVNLKARFNTSWKDSVDKNPKENSNNVKYQPADIIIKCHICQSTTHLANTCPKRGKINEIDIEKEPDVEKDNNTEEYSDDKSSIFPESSKDIENINATFDIMESYSPLPQLSNGQLHLSKFQDSHLMKTKPNRVKGYTAGSSCITEVVINKEPTKPLLDPGAFFSCVGKYFHKTWLPNFEDHLLSIDGIKFNSSSNPIKALGIFETNIIFSHINENRQELAFLPFERQIRVNKEESINLELERFKSEQLNKAEISLHLTDNQENDLSALLYDHRGAFASDKEPLRPAYPARPKSREALEIDIKQLLDLGVIRKLGHNEEVEITRPVIVAWHNGKSRMVGGFRALNTYTFPDRYPIPKIQISLTQISQAMYISTMDALKGFHRNVVTPRASKYLRIIFIVEFFNI